jgi:hypothetical protein
MSRRKSGQRSKHRSQSIVGANQSSINFILETVDLDVIPQSLNDAYPTFFLDSKYITYRTLNQTGQENIETGVPNSPMTLYCSGKCSRYMIILILVSKSPVRLILKPSRGGL